jgi:hypothetical protein
MLWVRRGGRQGRPEGLHYFLHYFCSMSTAPVDIGWTLRW